MSTRDTTEPREYTDTDRLRWLWRNPGAKATMVLTELRMNDVRREIDFHISRDARLREEKPRDG